MSSDVPWRNEISTEEVAFSGGNMIIPDKPGLGIDITEEAIRKYPYTPHGLRHYQDELTNIRPTDATDYFKSKK